MLSKNIKLLNIIYFNINTNKDIKYQYDNSVIHYITEDIKYLYDEYIKYQ